MTDGDELAELRKQVHELQRQTITLKALVLDLLAGDMAVADVAVSLAARKHKQALDGLEGLRAQQLASYKKLEESFEQR